MSSLEWHSEYSSRKRAPHYEEEWQGWVQGLGFSVKPVFKKDPHFIKIQECLREKVVFFLFFLLSFVFFCFFSFTVIHIPGLSLDKFNKKSHSL